MNQYHGDNIAYRMDCRSNVVTGKFAIKDEADNVQYFSGLPEEQQRRTWMTGNHLNSAIAAYCFFEKKPAIDVNFVKDRQLVLF